MAMKPVRVSQVNRYLKRILTTDPILANLSVVGEVSNLTYHSSGHVYFSLKDENSKLNCFFAAENARKARCRLADGMEITVHGYLSVYERGGSYSLHVREIEVQGKGNLALAFEELRDKLMKEGIFDSAKKKKIPFFPKKVVVVTSATGAAVQDILKIIRTRNDYADVLVYPAAVQGPGAAAEIAAAIDDVNRRFPDTDVMIVGRGGGSLEELWAFNEEKVARAIADSAIPIISAVGHETDFTIADFAADLRAETPTAAAALAVPDIRELKDKINRLREEMRHALRTQSEYRERLLAAVSPEMMLHSLTRLIEIRQLKTEAAYRQLCDLSPMKVLERGYAAILDQTGHFAGSAAKFQKGERFTAVFRDGRLIAEVIGIEGEKHDER